jgi:hypothetical protein
MDFQNSVIDSNVLIVAGGSPAIVLKCSVAIFFISLGFRSNLKSSEPSGYMTQSNTMQRLVELREEAINAALSFAKFSQRAVT